MHPGKLHLEAARGQAVRAISCALLIAALGFGEARAQAGSAQFDGWSAVCDDVGECSAWASGGGPLAPSYLLLRRDANGQWSAHFGISTFGSQANAIELGVIGPGGKATWTHHFEAPADDRSMRRTTIFATREISVFRDATAQGLTLEIRADGKVDPLKTISLKGSAAALLWIQDQGSAPRRPVIRRSPIVSQAHLPRTPPSADALCDGPFLKRLSPGKILAATSCRAFEDKSESSTSMQLLDEDGRRIPGPLIEGLDDDDNGFASATYDPKTRILSAHQAGEYGFGSCGMSTQWVWDGARFRVARQTQMVDCVGIPQKLWPSNRRVRVIDAPGRR
jgi:hypothetical protein